MDVIRNYWVSYQLAKGGETDSSTPMTKEEDRQTLRVENHTHKALVAELLLVKEQLAQANERIKELEDRLAKDHRTRSKAPTSVGLGRLPRHFLSSERKTSWWSGWACCTHALVGGVAR